MSLYHYLQLQPVEATDDGTVSELDQFEVDEIILEDQDEGASLIEAWSEISSDIAR